MRSIWVYFICAIMCTDVHAQNSMFDPTFGVNGLSTIDVGADRLVLTVGDMQPGPDGKILLAGLLSHMFSPVDSSEIAVIRLNADGTVDSTYGSDGVFRTVKPDLLMFKVILKVLPDGRSLVAGGTSDGSYDQTFVLRLTADGAPDPAFAANGWFYDTNSADGSLPQDMAIQPDGKLIVAIGSIMDCRIVRLNVDGSADTSFGVAGTAPYTLTPPLSIGQIQLHVRTDGKMIVLCSAYNGDPFQPDLHAEQVISLFTQFGQPDSTYLLHGPDAEHLLSPMVSASLSNSAYMPDGSIYFGGTAVLDNYLWSYVVVHVDANGELDPAFGDGTGYTIYTNDNGQNPSAWIPNTDMMVTSDGKILLYGTYQPDGSTPNQCELIRFTHDGHLDEGFGTGGRMFLGENAYYSTSVADQADGKILAGAIWSVGGYLQFGCLRLTSTNGIGMEDLNGPDPLPHIALYPNPTHDQVRVSYSTTGNGPVSISLSDAQGRTFMTWPASHGGITGGRTEVLDLPPSITPGLYFLQVQDADERQVVKLQVE